MKAVIFVYVWPEPLSSAAGVRSVGLCQDLRALGYEVTALSPCRENAASEALNQQGIATLPCPANDSDFVNRCSSLNPSLVIYDRFVMEEQFGWRARDLWPSAFHLVDTQDIHSVRRARERIAARNGDVMCLEGELFSPDLERELASLYRADACLVVSDWERDWLIDLGYPKSRVLWLPFAAAHEGDAPNFSARRGFAFLGNFRHPPNIDAVKYLSELWPELATLGEKLFLYGAYPPAFVSALNGKNGIVVAGPVKDHRRELKKHRVMLAPLRFGAGIKGKVLEARACDLPVVGTPVALEGLGGMAVSEPRDILARARILHEDESEWSKARDEGRALLASFQPEVIRKKLFDFLKSAPALLPEWRSHIISRMLKHHQHNSTKYFSRWIEEKNKGGINPP